MRASSSPRGRAVFDRSRRYRYLLVREWDPARPLVAFVLLNPNRADAQVDDPTIRRCVGYAHDWGYGSLSVTNLFALRARHFGDVRAARDPVGPSNDAHISRAAREATLVVLGWGARGSFRGRDREVLTLLAATVPRVLRLTRSGHPGHPLYLKRTLRPRPLAIPPRLADADRAGPR